ncbi:hypothetical protein HU200_033969 [Digitaria exilis]|uniref:Small auxin up regulated protein n=1 Tax=Digitaria exilis TaxID=1010633 RepID=A0A835BKB0_9POAL|nr:hypothetical protein HU200_033969 [Digitaria exilis]
MELKNALTTSSEASRLTKHMTYSTTAASQGSVILPSSLVNPNSSCDMFRSSPKTAVPKRKGRFKAPTMISAKRIAQLAKKWQRMAAHGRKRLTWGAAAAKEADECSTTSVASRGHCAVYTADGARFEVPVASLGTAVFAELLRMSREEFGFAGGDGRITLPCDAAVMEYAMCLLRTGASDKLEQAFLSTMAMPCHYASRVGVPAHLGASRQVAVYSCSSVYVVGQR